MLDTLVLIKKSPHQALIDILNYHNNLMIQYNTVEFVNPTVVSGKATQVTIRAIPVTVGKPSVINEKTFIFNRLDLTEFFATADPDFTVALPATTQSIIDLLADRYELVVTPVDFIIENIGSEATTYTLQADSASLRWVGSVSVNLIAPGTQLSSILTINVLNGLYLPYSEDALSNVLTVTDLDGIVADIRVYNIAQVFTNTDLGGYWIIGDEGYAEVITPTATGRTLLHNLLLLNNDQPIEMADYTASVLTGGGGAWNARVRLRGVAARNYYGEVILDYNRYSVADYFGAGDVELKTDFPNDFNLLRHLETEFDCLLADNEFIVTGVGYGTWTLSAKGNSLGWFGTKSFTVAILTPPFYPTPYVDKMVRINSTSYYPAVNSVTIIGPAIVGTYAIPQPWTPAPDNTLHYVYALDGAVYLNDDVLFTITSDVVSLSAAFHPITGTIIVSFKYNTNDYSTIYHNGILITTVTKELVLCAFQDSVAVVSLQDGSLYINQLVMSESGLDSISPGVEIVENVSGVLISADISNLGSPLLEGIVVKYLNSGLLKQTYIRDIPPPSLYYQPHPYSTLLVNPKLLYSESAVKNITTGTTSFGITYDVPEPAVITMDTYTHPELGYHSDTIATSKDNALFDFDSGISSTDPTPPPNMVKNTVTMTTDPYLTQVTDSYTDIGLTHSVTFIAFTITSA